MTTQQSLKAHIDGNFQIDCLDIRAIQNSAANPIIYYGVGEIRLDDDGILQLKMDAKCNRGPAAVLKSMFSGQSGALYKPDDYYQIIARDGSGNTWISSRELLSINSSSFVGPIDAVISTRMSKLDSETLTFDPSEKITLFLANQEFNEWHDLIGEWDIGAPYTGYRFKITPQDRSHVCVEVSTKSSFPHDFETRILEALAFVLSDTLPVRIIQHTLRGRVRTSLRSVKTARASSQRFPPIEIRSGNNSKSAIDLIGRYMQFAQSSAGSGIWHNCSAHLAHARQASANSLDAWTVGVCVALEGVASYIPAPESIADLAKIDAITKFASKILRRFKVDQHLQNRVNGLLGQLKHTRVKDRLAPLIASGRDKSGLF